jgi:hypothetical protein
MTEFDRIQSAVKDERLQSLQDRRFYSIAGAQWEGPLNEQFENRPKFEVNKIALSVQRICSEYRANRISVNYTAKDGEYDSLADVCDGLFRSDEQDSVAEEAYDNAFEEAVAGGFGAWRLRAVYESEEDDEDERQRIRIEPIFDADSSVFFDLQAKRQDKADATRCFVLTSMTHDAYKAAYDDDPTSWPKTIHQYEFDWCTPDVVYVAEYYRVEDRTEVIRVFRSLDGSEEKYRSEDLDDELLAQLEAIGSFEVRQKRVKRRKVRKYILSGNMVLEDCGYLPGRHIPIVPVYGKRWYIDNIERFCGHVRLAKDAQRLANMQRSKLAEIAAYSSIEKPIFFPEQIAGHQVMWQEDNLRNYPYLLVNPISAPDGSMQAVGPVGYTKAPAIPQAMAALLQLTEQDIRDVLGNSEQGEKVVSNVSGKAVDLVQQKLDMQTFLYMSNYAKGVRRGGEIWLSMAKDIYVEPGRKMKMLGEQEQVSSVELMRPVIGEDGEIEHENDLTEAEFDVAVDVGPSSSSKRAATVRALTQMMAVTSDQQAQQVLQAAALMNMEGEGLSDIRDYFRKQLVQMGVMKPTEEEAQQLAAAGQQQDPNTVFLQAAAEEAMAKAAKARADVVKTVAESELTQAKTVETLSKVGGEGATQEGVARQVDMGMQMASPMQQGGMSERERIEMDTLAIENEIKRRQLMEQDALLERVMAERDANITVSESSNGMRDVVSGLGDSVAAMGEVVGQMREAIGTLADSNKANVERALQSINRPKRLVRERGRIVGIETDED